MKKRTEISIEIDELVVITAGRAAIPCLPCPVCAERAMVTPEAAAALARVTVRSVYARVEAGSVHFLETPDGVLLLCADSLGERARFDELKQLVCATNRSAETPTEKE